MSKIKIEFDFDVPETDFGNMRTLHLTLKRKWFDLIKDGIKTEEYREIKPHWTKRLRDQEFDSVKFVNGYGCHRPSMVFILEGIREGIGRPEWGAPEERVFILEIGDRIDE
jgi:hypothetical protein